MPDRLAITTAPGMPPTCRGWGRSRHECRCRRTILGAEEHHEDRHVAFVVVSVGADDAVRSSLDGVGDHVSKIEIWIGEISRVHADLSRRH